MGTKGSGFVLAVGVLGSILAGAAPAWAQGHGGGGGGHASGGHFGGGGHAAGGHFAGGGHAAAGGHYAGGAPHGYAGGGYAHGYPAAYHGGYAGHGYPGGGYGHGYSTGAYWRGGYWHGGFWPRSYYGVGFSWFLPVLPLAYATYWYGGIPYYYANDVYYTWNPSYDGYTATDPPPVADPSGADAGAAALPDTNMAPPNGGGGPGPGDPAAGGQIFMYPKNGQSAEQQAIDKSECQKWAGDQAGQVAQNGYDYHRAMMACVEGRGYSAQ